MPDTGITEATKPAYVITMAAATEDITIAALVVATDMVIMVVVMAMVMAGDMIVGS